MPIGINAIPDELLYYTFLAIVRETFFDGHCIQRPTQPPWNIAAVSKRWRRICLNGPRLWTYISFNTHCCKADSQTCNGLDLIRANNQVTRSASLPLVVNIGPQYGCELEKSLMTVFTTEYQRWQTLTLSDVNTGRNKLPRLLLSSNDVALQLHTLHYTGSQSYGHTLYFPLSHSDKLPSLRTAYVRRWSGRILIKTPFPWQQLTTFHLTSYVGDIMDIIRALDRCRGLHNFCLHSESTIPLESTIPFVREQDYSDPHKNSILLSHLTDLRIECDMSPISADFPAYVRSPNLRYCTFLGVIPPAATEDIIDFFIRSACKVTTTRSGRVTNSSGHVQPLNMLDLSPLDAVSGQKQPVEGRNIVPLSSLAGFSGLL